MKVDAGKSRRFTLLTLFLGVLFLVSYIAAHHVRIVHVVSDSMAPEFYRGDILITQHIPASALQVGDIPILESPGEPGVLYSHRIIFIERHARGERIRTQGDANPIPDEWSYQISPGEVPVYMAKIPLSQMNKFDIAERALIAALLVLAISCLALLLSLKKEKPKPSEA